MSVTETVSLLSSLCVRHTLLSSRVCSLCSLFDQHVSRRLPEHLPSVLQAAGPSLVSRPVRSSCRRGLTMARLIVAVLAMAMLTMATLTMAILTMARPCVARGRCTCGCGTTC